MTPKELTAFRLDPSLLDALRIVKERDGLAISEQVRQAIVEWLQRRHAEPGDLHRAFDFFESSITAADNRGDGLDEVVLPKEFGPKLGGRMFGSLTESDMQALETFAKALRRREKTHRDYYWKKSTRMALARARQRDMKLPNMSDNDARHDLFRLLATRLRDESRKDQSLHVFERPPILMVERRGHGAEIDQGHGPRVMRGTMTWRRDEDGDAPHEFSVSRSADKKRLVMTPGPEGGFDAMVDDIVTTFLLHSTR